MAIEAELLAKRRRLGLPDSNLLSASTTTISNVVLRKWSGHKKDGGPATSKYCPSDRSELLRRLGTFHELTDWTPKPDRVNEVEWAKRGWVCQGKERVRCTLCNKEVVVGLNKKMMDGKEVSVLVPSEIGRLLDDVDIPNPNTNDSEDTALVEKYVALIVESHQEDCLWRRRGCDGMFISSNQPSLKCTIYDRYEGADCHRLIASAIVRELQCELRAPSAAV